MLTCNRSLLTVPADAANTQQNAMTLSINKVVCKVSRGSCHVMVVSDRYRAQTGYQTSRIHSFSTVWSSGSNVTQSASLSFSAPSPSDNVGTSGFCEDPEEQLFVDRGTIAVSCSFLDLGESRCISVNSLFTSLGHLSSSLLG